MDDNNVKLFIYMNPFAAIYADHGPVADLIRNTLQVTEWYNFYARQTSSLNGVASEFDEDAVFYAGIAFEQYRMTSKGGVFINPVMGGLNTDYPRWSKIIQGDQTLVSVFVDVPYDLYADVAVTPDLDRDQYESMSYALQGVTADLNQHKTAVYH